MLKFVSRSRAPYRASTTSRVPVPMMQVRIVRVDVHHLSMGMRMPMGFCPMSMRMVDVMTMPVVMFERDMAMAMRMILGQVQPHPTAHQHGCDHKRFRETITQNNDSACRPNKRCN